MKKNAEAMLAEAARLEGEAQQLNGTPAKNGTRKTTKKAKASQEQKA